MPAIILNTTLAATFGGLAGMALTWRLDRRPDVVTIMNASLAGLVAITASAHIMSPWKAAVIGGVGAVVMRLVTRALERMRIDDAVGAVPVHLGAGIWGTLAVGLLGDADAFPVASSNLEQVGIQLVGVGVAFAWAFGVGYLALSLINRHVPFRIDDEGELAGLNIAEHDASTAMSDLLSDMDEHRRTGDITRPVHVEPHTEVGRIAAEYNRVLDAVRHRSDSLQLLRRTSAAANESSSVEEALALALGEVCEFTGWPVGHAFLVSRDDPNELVSTGIWRISDEERYAQLRAAKDGRRVQAGQGLPGVALETRKPALAASGELAVPIMAGSHVVGVMEFFSEQPLPADSELLDLLLSVGTQLGRVVERQRSEEARLRALIDNMPAHVYLRDLSGRFILVNRQYEEFWGLRLDEIRGQDARRDRLADRRRRAARAAYADRSRGPDDRAAEPPRGQRPPAREGARHRRRPVPGARRRTRPWPSPASTSTSPRRSAARRRWPSSCGASRWRATRPRRRRRRRAGSWRA